MIFVLIVLIFNEGTSSLQMYLKDYRCFEQISYTFHKVNTYSGSTVTVVACWLKYFTQTYFKAYLSKTDHVINVVVVPC